ncbi:MAG: glycosyltransferase 87 family protein [Acidobacteriota bacterium]
MLAWRLFHDPRLSSPPAWLAPFLPSPSGAIDRDPIALLLAGLATVLALAYAALGVFGARPAWRARVIALAAVLLIVLPTAAFIGLGAATDRPYGQDGGVVQLPLALDVILAGESPYAADYSGTILAKQARASTFWDDYGGNPILHHHAYLPGTHLLMMPFYLASRQLFGFFDPRFVTLLFYALVVALAARLPQSDDSRLAAAGLAALNPLVYWHQIFGANDLVFVAILLAAVLAARNERLLLAGALVGLACSVKQLAWPYAPFLLVALSGARGWRDLLSSTPWRRLGKPLAAAVVVFVVVVLPLAAVDFEAFWGDIVAYNVGLPGDNYPLGGTPGLGFANYLIYFGQVESLSDHVSFSAFYAFLIPLGLLLVHRQMRWGGTETALVTGSVALVAAVYFSRVVHPNYLIPAAVLLPVGVLARRLRADLALVPLLLFAMAVEIAEGGIFRTTWDQAVAAGLPVRLGGLAAVLAPRAGPTLTQDALGLLFSATAAGLAIAYLTAGVTGAGRRARLTVIAVAGVLVVAVPLLVVVRVSDRTGLFRAQDPGVVQSAGDAKRLVSGRSPYTPPPEDTPRGREAYSTSFTLEPPVEIRPDRPNMPPGPSLLAALGRVAGRLDIRLSVLAALALLAFLVAGSGEGETRPATLALVLLLPPLALGTVLGASMALPLVALFGAWLLARRGPPWAAGLLAGLAVGLDHRALLLGPLLLVSLAERPRAWKTAVGTAAAGYAVLVLPVALLDLRTFAARLFQIPAPGLGLGVFNLFTYYGVEGSATVRFLAALAPLAALLVTAALLRRREPALALAGLAALAWVALAPSVSPDAVGVPIVLLGLAVCLPEDSSQSFRGAHAGTGRRALRR